MSVFLALGAFQLNLPACASLKDKRSVVKSLKDRISARFNAAVAELDFQDKWQRCLLGVALLSGDRRVVEQQFRQIEQLIANDVRVLIADAFLEFR